MYACMSAKAIILEQHHHCLKLERKKKVLMLLCPNSVNSIKRIFRIISLTLNSLLFNLIEMF